MRFINLTDDNGNGIIVNLDNVLKFRKRARSKGSLIVKVGNDLTNVKETLADITILIKETEN